MKKDKLHQRIIKCLEEVPTFFETYIEKWSSRLYKDWTNLGDEYKELYDDIGEKSLSAALACYHDFFNRFFDYSRNHRIQAEDSRLIASAIDKYREILKNIDELYTISIDEKYQQQLARVKVVKDSSQENDIRSEIQSSGDDPDKYLFLYKSEGTECNTSFGNNITPTTTAIFTVKTHSAILVKPNSILQGCDAVNDHMAKCIDLMADKYYEQAMAETGKMLEALYQEILGPDSKKAKAIKRYKSVKGKLNLQLGNDKQYPKYVSHLLELVDKVNKSIINNRNDNSHAEKADKKAEFNPNNQHHARLTIEMAIALTNFLLSSHTKQQTNSKPTT